MQPSLLLVTNDFPPAVGGIQVVHAELAARLDPDRTYVLAPGHDDAAAFDTTVPYPVQRIGARSLQPTPETARILSATIERVRPDVVVFGSALPLSMLGRVCTRHGVPYVPMVYGADISVPARLPGPDRALAAVLRPAAGIVTTGGWVVRDLERVCGPGRTPPIEVMLPGIETERFCPGDARAARERLGLDPDRPTVTSISRLVPRKGMHLLLQATALLRAVVPDVHVAIGGSGRERQRLDRLVHELDLGRQVTFLGRVPDDALADVHRAGDVCTMLCHDRWLGVEQEGFGIVFLEASSCGRPVVAGDSGGACEAVEDGVTGLVVDAKNPRAVARALEAYLSDPDLAAAHGAAGRTRAVEHFTWDSRADLFRAWIDGLVPSIRS